MLAVAAACIGVLGVALYLQHVLYEAPCPWCVIQRYGFVLLALICLSTGFLSDKIRKIGGMLAMLVSLSGAGAASWHLWVQAHPGFSCGLDPLETSLNKIPTATLLPWLFEADGICSTPYPPILGLSIPQWSLVCFVVFAIVLGRVAFRKSQ